MSIEVRLYLAPAAIMTAIVAPVIVLESVRWVAATGPVGSID